jgi:hypothetical protein
MHPQTIATVEQLERAKWFTNVGVEDAQETIVLSSWQEAIEHCSSVEWENLCLEARNQYSERLIERSRVRFNQWNDIVASIKVITEPIVRKKVEAVVRDHDLPKVFEDTVQWDILHVCMEAEYADVYQPGFYASQAFWYINGHFPCGWEGSFPNGTLIVY